MSEEKFEVLGLKDIHQYINRIHTASTMIETKRLVRNVFLALNGRHPPSDVHWFLIHRLNGYEIIKRTTGLTSPELKRRYIEAKTYNPECIEDERQRLIVSCILGVTEMKKHKAVGMFKQGRILGLHAVKQFNQVYL